MSLTQLETKNIFKNTFINFKKYFKTIKSNKLNTNKISFDFVFDSIDIKQYDLKYFKIISTNKFENNYDIENENNNASEYIELVKFNQNKYHPLFSFSQKNNSLQKVFLNKKSLNLIGNNRYLENETQLISKKRKMQYTFENIINFNNNNEGILTFYLQLNKVNNLNNLDKSIYNFYIYAYDSNDNIIDKTILMNQDIEKYLDTELYKNNIFEDTNTIDSKILNDFNIEFQNKDENFEKKRTVSFLLGKDLYRTLINFKKNKKSVISKIIITEYYENHLLSSTEKLDNFENISQFVFNTYIKISNNSRLKYVISIEYSNRKVVSKNIYHDISNKYIKDKDKNDDILKDNLLIKNLFKNIESFYLQKERLLKINIQFNSSIKSKYFDPIFNSVLFNNEELIHNCYLDISKQKKIDLFSQNVSNFSNGLLTIYIDLFKFNNFLSDQYIKINFQKKFDIKEFFSFESKITIINNNLNKNDNNKVYSSLNYLKIKDIDLNSNFTNLDLSYFFDISNLSKLENLSQFSTENKLLENILNKNYSQLLSDAKKVELEKNINVNNFYLLLKKNILLENNIKNERYHLISIQPDSNGNLFHTFTDINIPNFKEVYTSPIKYKEIYFESKLLIIPDTVFQLNEYKFKNFIKNSILQNKIDQKVIVSDNIITSIFAILNKLNINNISSINEFEIEYLYKYYSLDYSYAKSENVKSELKKQNINMTKNILINNEIIDVKYSKDNKINFNFDINIEELVKLNIQKETIFNSLNEIFKKNKLLSGFYLIDENKLFKDFYKIFFENKKQQYYSNKIYLDLISEINLYSNVIYTFKSKNIVNIEFEINLKNTPMLLHFLNYCKNITKNLSLKKEISLEKNLYQKIFINNSNIQYYDKNNNHVQIEIVFPLKELYLKYFNLSLI